MAATRTMGLLSLIKSGEITRAGRSPACSDPTTGSSLTRTTSPRRGLVVNGTMNLLLEWMVFFFNFQVHVGHGRAALDNLAPQSFPPGLFKPVLHQGSHEGAAFPGRHLAFECVHGRGGQCVGAFYQIHHAYSGENKSTRTMIPLPWPPQ